MTNTNVDVPALEALLAAPLYVAEPDVAGPLAVFPLIASAAPKLSYVAFAAGQAHGVELKELAGGARVNELEVHNPLDCPVLLYEGEEVLGAQQNRTFDVSVLVPAGASLRVPVSCVERGRWDSRRHGEAFVPAPQAAHPELRRLKGEQVRRRAAAGGAPRASQQAVWESVAATSARLGVESPTGALHDIFEDRRELLGRAQREIEMKCSQVGMLAAIAGRFVVLDYVSEVEAFAALHDPLVAGYALDALGAPDAPAPSREDASDFLALLLAAPSQRFAGVGLGEGVRVEFGGLAATGLAADRELVALTAFGAGEAA